MPARSAEEEAILRSVLPLVERACPMQPVMALVALHPIVDVLGPIALLLLDEGVDSQIGAVSHLRKHALRLSHRLDVGETPLAQLHATLLAALLVVGPARVDGSEALVAEHGRRLESALVGETARTDHPTPVVLHRLFLHAREQHHVVHWLVVVGLVVGAQHGAGKPLAPWLVRGRGALVAREVHRHRKARLEHVHLRRHLLLLLRR
mmetsp:Transcript_6994/g.16306  ORF Transcript_6994/g.16306 Transcript_6994/m.16306 type:complete len:207 (-) Transcript_6994:1379-1999(-)